MPSRMQGAILGAVCLLVVAVYACTARAGFLASRSLNAADDYYNLLVQGFRAGQLSLKKDVPEGFKQLADPYDREANAGYGLLDLSYYKGKFYLYFGATPAIVLFWPYVALTDHYLSQKDAAVLFCVIGFLAGAGLLRAIWRRYFAEVNVAVVAAGVVGLGLATFIPIVLARVDVYEVAISCGYAFTMVALTAIWKALHDTERRGWWLAAASLAYGLAVGARPSLLFGAVILLAPVIQAWRERRRIWSLLAAAMGPIIVVGIGVLVYNDLRFDSPFDFGWRWALAGDRQINVQSFSLRYLWFNFRVFFLEPAHWSAHWPFVHDVTIPPLPAGHGRVDRPFGVLTAVPLVWLALAAPLAWRGRPSEARFALSGFLGAVTIAFVIGAVTLCLFFGACTRYEVEFLSPLMLLAVIGVLSVERALILNSNSARVRGPAWRCLARLLWSLLLAFSVVFTLLASVEFRADSRNNFGMSLQEAGQSEAAIQQFREAMRLNPDFAEAHYNLALVYEGAGQRQEAIRHWEEALRLEPDFPEAENNLGAALMAQGEVREAIDHYQQAVRLKPGFAGARYNLAVALEQAGRVREAIEEYKQVLRYQPESTAARNNLGVALMGQGQVPEAMEQYEQALRIKPENTEAHYNLGIALTRLGRIADAITQYEQALRIRPDFAEAHARLGAAFLLTNRIRDAIGQCEQAVQVKPDYAEGHFGLGNALAEAGRTPEAIGQYEQAVRIKPNYAEAHYKLGRAQLNTGNVPEAIRQFETALRLDPKNAEAHNDLGGALFNGGKVSEAITHFEMALQINPGSADALYNLGTALLAEGKAGEAAEQFEHALRINPDDADVHYEFGVALEKDGKQADAIAQYEAAVRLRPDFAEAQKCLTRLRAGGR